MTLLGMSATTTADTPFDFVAALLSSIVSRITAPAASTSDATSTSATSTSATSTPSIVELFLRRTLLPHLAMVRRRGEWHYRLVRNDHSCSRRAFLGQALRQRCLRLAGSIRSHSHRHRPNAHIPFSAGQRPRTRTSTHKRGTSTNRHSDLDGFRQAHRRPWQHPRRPPPSSAHPRNRPRLRPVLPLSPNPPRHRLNPRPPSPTYRPSRPRRKRSRKQVRQPHSTLRARPNQLLQLSSDLAE